MDLLMNRDEQENERAALKSIYGDDMIALSPETDVLADWKPLECMLTLRPVRISGPQRPDPPHVVLHVTCSEQYPTMPPQIQLEQWKRVSNDNIVRLENELKSRALELSGGVMIFELAQHVENFLHDVNQPGYESFYEEMMMRQKNEVERERQLKEAEVQKKKQEVRAQIQVTQQAVKKALRKRQNSLRGLEEEIDTPPPSPEREKFHPYSLADMDINLKNNKSDENPWTLCEKGQSRFEHEFEHLQPLGQGAFGHVIKVRNKLDDGLYAIKRIVLDPSEKQLNKKITREVKLLSRLNHENVVRYYNSWIESSDIPYQDQATSEEVTPQPKKCDDRIMDMLPRNEPSLNWLDENSSSSDENTDDFVVVFRSKSENGSSSTTKGNSSPEVTSDISSIKSPRSLRQTLIIYIQMELCDKSTLRLAIDNGLHADMDRVWRLFREIVEGLCHIHQQGIIHRDLKPVNVFIGHDDHVKIGDFGLATTIILQKQSVRDAAVNTLTSESLTPADSNQTDASQTGQVGTVLYVAPELNISMRSSYNQKVDIFSLGVIFFEMCSPPMPTSMERFKILTDLRQSVPIFPDDFPLDENSPQRILIRSMLQHDIDKRPSAQDLLQNSAIPPPKREESEVSLMIKSTLSNPQSRNYKHLISSCFNQAVQPSLDATYNVSSWRSPVFTSSLEVVSHKLRTIFQNHGAVSLLPPLLTPAGVVLESSVCLMTRFGSIVYATHDLQVPFARYLAQNHSMTQFRRYAIDKVYRERPAGVHPKENYEGAFDIITPTPGDMAPEFEIMCVIWEILKEFPSILTKSCTIYLNHNYIVSLMLKAAGLNEPKYKTERTNFLQKNAFFLSRNDNEVFLKSLALPEKCVSVLLQWMEMEGPINRVYHMVSSMVKDNEDLPALKFAFQQLEVINNFTQIIGISCPILVNLKHLRNAHYYSGVMIQIVCSQKNRPKPYDRTVFLSGGRYDSLVQYFKESLSRDDVKVNQHVVGFTLSINKLMFSIEDDEKVTMIDVLVCLIGTKSMSQDKLSLLQDLWKSGLRISFVDSIEDLEEIQMRSKDMGIPAIVLMKETDCGFVRVRTLVKNRYFEKKVGYSDLIDNLLKFKTSSTEETSGFLKPEYRSQSGYEGPVISFITLDKLTAPVKRRYETQILNNVQSVIPKFSSKYKVEILALPIDSEVMKALCHYIDPNCNEPDFNHVVKKYPKQKKIILKFQDHMEDVKNGGEFQPIPMRGGTLSIGTPGGLVQTGVKLPGSLGDFPRHIVITIATH